ncbi:fibrillin-1-like isoform 2 [Corchorus capsularis]|uniref:Fibrillin-1-like isoform 2 n=1 Tax=Corchorus capsularis TaxID=210143 RepID=A0A1R3IWQ2_COCAP|nr:fibrillin-1-like isoform 2 [Corchorus capsularis]
MAKTNEPSRITKIQNHFENHFKRRPVTGSIVSLSFISLQPATNPNFSSLLSLFALPAQPRRRFLIQPSYRASATRQHRFRPPASASATCRPSFYLLLPKSCDSASEVTLPLRDSFHGDS